MGHSVTFSHCMIAPLPPLTGFFPRGTVTRLSVTEHDGEQRCTRHPSGLDFIGFPGPCDRCDGSFKDSQKITKESLRDQNQWGYAHCHSVRACNLSSTTLTPGMIRKPPGSSNAEALPIPSTDGVRKQKGNPLP